MNAARLLVMAYLMADLPSSAATLQQLLVSYKVPITSFSQQEWATQVQGTGSMEPTRTVIAYQPIGANQLLGRLAVLAYRKSDNSIVRATAALLPDGDLCTGAVAGLDSLDGLNVLSTSISPSANCALVLDSALHCRATVYGFNLVEVSPGSVILEEDRIHFAPVHPGRLRIAELATGKTLEIYPLQGDALRASFAAEHARHMPPAETCRMMNDRCDPRTFDEDIADLISDGKGTFAFLAHQSASDSLTENTPPKDFDSQTVLYVYRSNAHAGVGAWTYCEKKVEAGELVEPGRPVPRFFLAQAVALCSPTLPVART